MKLTMGEKLRILLKRKNVTIVELSRRIGTSNQNLANKFKRDNFSTKELEEIAEALGCEFEGYFVDKDGYKL
ncbi:helix-turn-helix domain-containing protein [Tepidibacter hydrothermalis]|uniref:Helix-turn-helix transcriptional regulator n=1 Tax=Tepidibacter hydrothermalis TaxID=3036126 RepID=A0ABY8ED28_9FIRM|nr:helix-turn-helix transcriptional regulator [Tepidibacter hydrothermalis]WFD10839.1 helix-turn-helix transcriptional regulator [Tepidibacter hydrothermalis]